MAATSPLEEFFVKDSMEESPLSPSLDVFPPKQEGGRSEGCHHHVPSDMMLPYVSRMLMEDEDDTEDKLLSDHPALLQVEQPFAQILSSPSLGAINGDTNNMLQDGGGDERTPNYSSLSRCAYAVVGEFLKSMDEANMLLPGDNGFISDEQQVNQMVRRESSHRQSGSKKRNNRDDNLEDEVITRSSKAMMMIKEPEDICAHETMLEDMMSNGHETYIRDLEKLRIDMANEAQKKSSKGGKKAVSNHVVDVSSLLIFCAQAVAANDHARARDLLKQIKQHASETGDVTQRLAQCFARGLEARLLGMGSQLWQLQLAERLSIDEYLKAHNLYMAACSINKVVVCFSTMTIMEAMEGKTRLHIVDYGMRFGFHWAHLLRLLASREGDPPEVRITAIVRSRLRPCPAELIEDTGCRLIKCAHESGLPFSFHVIRKRWEEVCIEDLDKYPDEVLVVNDHFNFSTLMDESIFFDNPSPRDTVLHNIKKMRPDIFIQSILNNSYGCSYLSRFKEALFYYTAMFDMFDATMPRESKSRVVLEQGLFGRAALNVIACEGIDLLERPEKYRQWQARNQRAGLRQLPLEPTIVNTLKEEVRMCHHKDLLICEDGQWLLQGWMGRILFALSTWVAEESSSE
ncbi:scarecrow-like protein 9 [Miscanthus floridulus]|uniref:scarecrow-like protein 9 n=1 Tax=Miscanthus floridulus TaxID=154761 RepID=UPI0034588911